MKKLLPALFICLFSFSAIAQDSDGKGVHPGLKVSPMFSFIRAEFDGVPNFNVESNGAKLGFAWGGMLDYMFANNIGLGFELRLAHLNHGYTISPTSGSGATGTYDVKQQYVQLPVSLKMKTNEIGYMKYFGQFGLAPSINVRSRANVSSMLGGQSQTITNSDGEIVTGENLNFLKPATPLNFFLIIGGGLEYNLGGTTSLVAGVSYEQGLVNVIGNKNFSNWYGNPVPDIRLRVIALNLGILF